VKCDAGPAGDLAAGRQIHFFLGGGGSLLARSTECLVALITTARAVLPRALQEYFGYHYDMRWVCVAIILAYIVAFRVGAIIATRYISYQRR
jgi:CDR ABC transporter